MTQRRLAGYFLGLRDYRSVLQLQEQLMAARIAGTVGDTVLFAKYSGNDVVIDGEEHLIMREEDILAIVDR